MGEARLKDWVANGFISPEMAASKVVQDACLLYAADTPQPRSGWGQARWWGGMAEAVVDALKAHDLLASSNPNPRTERGRDDEGGVAE